MLLNVDQQPTLPTENMLVHTICGQLAKTHADKIAYLQVAQYGTENPLHQLDTVFVEYATIDADAIQDLAEKFFPGFGEIMVEPYINKPELLDALQQKHEAGKDVAIVTEHESLMDVVYVTLAHNIALAKHTGEDFSEIAKRTHLVVSRTILSMDVVNEAGKITDAVNLLRFVGNLYFTLPDSARIRESGISQSTIDANNRKTMRKLIEQKSKNKSGSTVAVAAPGTVDKTNRKLDGSVHSVTINTVSDKTSKFLKRFDSVLPVAAAVEGDKKFCIPGDLKKINENNDTHRIMIDIAGARQWATGLPIGYRLFDSRK